MTYTFEEWKYRITPYKSGATTLRMVLSDWEEEREELLEKIDDLRMLVNEYKKEIWG